MTESRPKVLGTGLVVLDVVISQDPQTPLRSWAGGTCGNVLSILSQFGWDAYPIARMNNDPASKRIRTDMARWGVRLDYASCGPAIDTPVVVQEIRRHNDGSPRHRFRWSCPRCGRWLPGFRAVTKNAIEAVMPASAGASVFFLDRLSRAALTLAANASKEGAVVVFEPSGKARSKLFAEAIRIAHVVKYADHRIGRLEDIMQDSTAPLVEIQTMGAKGLRYRDRLKGVVSKWMHLNALRAPRLVDACGSGDWCTAGFITKTSANGQRGLRKGGAEGVRNALRYGQALAAWNCGFEGARGGMYVVDWKKFDEQIEAVLAGRLEAVPIAADRRAQDESFVYPCCSSDKRHDC